MATHAEVAAHLDLTRQAVSQMVAEGHLPGGSAGLDLDACRVAYIRRLREQAAGRMGAPAGDDGLDLVQERARLAKEQADKTAMENAARRGEMVDAKEVARAVGQMLGMARARLLALPARFATIGTADPAKARAKAKELIDEALDELARPPFDDAEPGAGTERGGENLDAAAEPDDQRVGRRRARAKPRGKRRAGKMAD